MALLVSLALFGRFGKGRLRREWCEWENGERETDEESCVDEGQVVQVGGEFCS